MMELTLEQVMTWHNGAHTRTSDSMESELCVLLLETLDTRVLGPPKMQSEEEKGLQAFKMGLVVL
jgi:hypothetical protein